MSLFGRHFDITIETSKNVSSIIQVRNIQVNTQNFMVCSKKQIFSEEFNQSAMTYLNFATKLIHGLPQKIFWPLFMGYILMLVITCRVLNKIAPGHDYNDYTSVQTCNKKKVPYSNVLLLIFCIW